jgi:hypothetical protein
MNEWDEIWMERAAEIVATFINVGLIVAGEFDLEHPGHLFLIEPVHPQTGCGHGRQDMQ